ncbi:Endoglucanase, partial [Phytophthora palmivora]
MAVGFAADFCDQWGTATTDDYIIYNNLWGESYATSGSQCTGLDSSSGSTVAWHTNWTWAGASSNVKSYANAALQFDAVQLSSISSIPTTLEYSLEYSGTIVADVSYDLFTSSTSDGDNEFEIMIWLAALGGAGPISSTGSAVATTTIADTEFSLYSGANGDTTVYSFVASDTVKSFSGDLMDFFTYLIDSESFSSSHLILLGCCQYWCFEWKCLDELGNDFDIDEGTCCERLFGQVGHRNHSIYCYDGPLEYKLLHFDRNNSTNMKVFFAAALTAAAVSVANAADFCDQWGQAKSGNYIIYNNLWGSSAATGGGKQCTGLDSGSGDSVSWHTTWSWQGGDKSVKSFSNAALEFDPVPLTEVKSIPSTMSYTVKYSGKVVADVAYDLFTSSTAKGEKEFEIMIWLAAIGGAGPISSTGKAIDTTTIAGTEWSVYSGPNGQMMVYSFVASKQVENFEGDLMEFFNYLTKSQNFKTSQYLIKVECGTEPFIGKDVTMKVSKYSAAVNTGSGGSTTPTQSGDSSSTGGQT